MSKEWDYAKLSALAKQNGGPEALVNKIVSASKSEGCRIGFVKGINAGYNKGVTDTLCVVFIIVGVSLIAYFSYKWYVKKVIKQLEEIPTDELEEAKKELIDGIKAYDQKQSESK